jgi:hypothetical protein
MRWSVMVAVFGLAAIGLCQAPPPNYFLRLTPAIFRISLPASGANPESHCFVWVRLGGLYDTEVACYVGGVFTGRLSTAPAGQGFDGGFAAPGGGFIRWLVCNPAVAGCVPPTVAPTLAPTLANPMYYELGAGLGDGSPAQASSGYY